MLPLSLRGTLYRVGPGRFERGGVKYAHPFDGDGRVDRIVIEGGRASVTSRFVETPQYLAEEHANVPLHRGAFGTASHLSLRTLKNPANTSLLHHGGELLALWEGGHATALDPNTLECLGPHTLGGAARVAPAFSMHVALDGLLGIGGDAVCAHTHHDPATGRLVVLLVKFSMGRTTLRFVEFDAGGFEVHSERAHVVDGFTHIHDFVVTPRHYVFYAPLLDFDPHAFRRGSGALECVEQRRGATRAVMLPRSGGGNARVLQAPQWFATHFINAVESDGELVVDTFGFSRLTGRVQASCFRPQRHVLDVEGGPCVAAGNLFEGTSEFPAVAADRHGLAYKHVFFSGTAAGGPMDTVVRLDASTGEVRYATLKGAFHGEPVLAGEFVLVCAVFEEALILRVLKAESMLEVGCVWLPGANPMGLHGLWVPGGGQAPRIPAAAGTAAG